MLYNIFYIILKMSCSTFVVAILLLSVKYVLQKFGFPRKITFFLWAVIAYRLICPVSIQTDISMFNIASTFYKQNYTVEVQVKDTTNRTSDVIRYVTKPSENNYSGEQIKTINKVDYIKLISASIWFVGMCVMLLFGAISFILLKKRLRFAIKLKENVYIAETIPTSFVFGIFKPKIFIPEITEEQDLENIIVHEKMHIKRTDHIAKIIAYMLLSVHWFNPLVWIMFNIFSDDMEFACDEEVLKKIGVENKKQYLDTLLVSAVNNRKTILLYNVCFSDNPTKRRVKNIIKLKTHSKGVAVTGVVICLLAAVVFGTNAAEHKGEQQAPAMQTNKDEQQAPAMQTNKDERQAPEIQTNQGEQQAPTMRTGIPLIVNANSAIDELYSTEIDVKENLETQSASTKDTRKENVNVLAAASNHAAPKDSATFIPQMQVIETEKNDISEKSQPDSIDFMQTIFEDDTKMENVEQNLNNKGITATRGNNVKLGENYILNDYSYEDNCIDTISNVSCDEDGNISLYFDVNAENLVDVTFTDSETKEVAAEFGILASDVNSYSFTGFNHEKAYDITVQGKTDSTWKIEGQYIVY